MRRAFGELEDARDDDASAPDAAEARSLDGTNTFDSSDTPMRASTSSRARRGDDIGSMIGAYKLVEPIGTGGMGAVYLAEQFEPVRRQVALKLIKAGMDSELVIARFEAERQTLALMEHDNIARVLDAGTSELGRPYFVMELVRGSPITRYCDEYGLSLADKLKLFITVCRAIQHAHQKGIIHRDLKPSNVLRLHAALLGGRLRSWDADTGVLTSDFVTAGANIFRTFHDGIDVLSRPRD